MSNGKKEAGQCWPFLSKWLAMLPIRVLSVRERQIGQRLFMMTPYDEALQDTSVRYVAARRQMPQSGERWLLV